MIAGACRLRSAHDILTEKAPELLAHEPTIERIDVFAGKVDVPALAPQPH